MRQRFRSCVVAALAGTTLLLAGCGDKETGPDITAPDEVPDVAEPVPAATAEPDLAKKDLGFSGTDSNGDGYVTSAEHAASSNKVFRAMDADEDGLLNVTELDAARDAMKVVGGPSSEKLIERADNDDDDRLTLAEFIGDVNARFAMMDTDRDGKLSPEEFNNGIPELPKAFATGVPQSPASAAPAAKPR